MWRYTGPMTWMNPLPLKLVPTAEDLPAPEAGTTWLPLPPHPGGFGVQRRHHVHEGVDLYAPVGTPVYAVEDGVITAVKPFTGPAAGLDWWLPTEAVWVEGATGAVLYGEIAPRVAAGQRVKAGELIGHVVRVLRHDKGRPTSMLHLELHVHGSTQAPEWLEMDQRPAVLRDPTPELFLVA